MNSLIEKIKKAPGFVSLQPAEREKIALAEDSLNLKFSDDYKEYATAFGAASFEGHELTGVCSVNRLDVVSVTEKVKTEGCYPDGMYVLEELHLDGIIVWQNSEGEVFITKPGAKALKTANTLEEYLKL